MIAKWERWTPYKDISGAELHDICYELLKAVEYLDETSEPNSQISDYAAVKVKAHVSRVHEIFMMASDARNNMFLAALREREIGLEEYENGEGI